MQGAQGRIVASVKHLRVLCASEVRQPSSIKQPEQAIDLLANIICTLLQLADSVE
jgi:hypothetical protein